tara:strand:+ start:1204 stop:1962 length:759 start_codon:yes stop_codon:yes gene_type:complete
MSLKKKRILITGASVGIGSAIAKRFAKEGANLYLVGGKNEKALNETIEICKKFNVQVLGECSDISDLSLISSLMSKAMNFLGGIDILVNCAGLRCNKPAHQVTIEDVETIFKINVMSAFALSSIAVDYMLEEKIQGQILNIGSTSGEAGVAYNSLYCATKGAMHLMTKAMAVELGSKGIRVNVLAPGTILSEGVGGRLDNDPEKAKRLMSTIPSGRFGNPDEVASCAAFMVSDEADYMNGAVILLDGGRLSW